MTSENGETAAGAAVSVGASMRDRYFHGWNVVGATFVMALFSFGLGFYGLTVYVATLQRLHGWSASTVSAPVTVYYVAGALLTASIGDLYERFGPRAVLTGGSVAMAAGVAALGLITQPWQLYPAFLVMSVGWGAMSGAAINIILAPWFQRRRGLVVSIAFNGATLGGVIVAPALIPLIGAVGFSRARGRRAAARRHLARRLCSRHAARARSARPRSRPRSTSCPTHGTCCRWRAMATRGRAQDVALLERVRSVRARARGAGRGAHAPRRAGDARARCRRRGAGRERRHGGGDNRPPRHRRGRRSSEPRALGERDAGHPDRRPGPAGAGAVGASRLRGLCPLRPRRRESHHAARPHSGRRVATRALPLAREPRGGDQPVH